MADPRDLRALQDELRQLRDELTATQIEVGHQRAYQLRYPADANSQSVFNQLFDLRLKSVLMDTLWKRVFRWFEPFDSLDGWNLSLSGIPGASLFLGGLWIETDAVAGDAQAAIRINSNWNTTNTFDRDSYMRFGCLFSKDSPQSNALYYMTIGSNLDNEGYYGFKVDNGSLYGVFSPGGTTEEVMTQKLLTIVDANDLSEASHTYLLEARYYAGAKVDFFVTVNDRGTVAKVASVPSATIRSTLTIPVELTFGVKTIFSFYVETRANEAKALAVFDLDYIEKLNVQ